MMRARRIFLLVRTQKLRQAGDIKGVKELLPLLGIGVIGGAVSALIAVNLFGAGILAAVIAYSLGGTTFTMIAAWRRFRCMESNDRKNEWLSAQ